MKQFLVLQLARFGDLVQTKRLILSLEEQGQVHLCIDISLAELAQLLYPKAIIHLIPAHCVNSSCKTLTTEHTDLLYNTIQKLKEIDFCNVYNINYTQLNSSLTRCFDSEIVLGYSIHAGQLLRSPWAKKAFHLVQDRNINPINLVDFWAYFVENPCAPNLVNPIALGQGKGLGVVMAGRESRRSLPPAVLAPVIRTFFESLGKEKCPIYFLGSKAEISLAKQVLRFLPSSISKHVQNLCGKTSWQELFDTLQGLDMLITPDTGTMHLAAHLGVPVQAFFLSSALVHETGPYGQGHSVWQSVYECAPCLESAPCIINTKCLDDFSQPSFFRTLTLQIQNRFKCKQDNQLLLPRSLTYQTSMIDDFGSAWNVQLGQDLFAEKRQILRDILATHCKKPLKDFHHSNDELYKTMLQYFYEDADGMLRTGESFSSFES